MQKPNIFIFIFLIAFSACEKRESSKTYTYGTESDSALYYFNKGWEHILDYGQWTLSERAFRKAVEFDSSFIIGKSLIGKNTRDLNERLALLRELRTKEWKVNEDNQLLLEITLETLELFNRRDQGIELSPEFIQNFYNIAELNYRKFIHQYPAESYMKAEYIEVLHAQHGAELALDSLNILTSTIQKEIPFFIHYKAVLESDMKNFEAAFQTANRFKNKMNDPSIPEVHVLFAKIFFQMDSFELAKSYITTGLDLEPNHIIATRLLNNILRQLENQSMK